MCKKVIKNTLCDWKMCKNGIKYTLYDWKMCKKGIKYTLYDWKMCKKGIKYTLIWDWLYIFLKIWYIIIGGLKNGTI